VLAGSAIMNMIFRSLAYDRLRGEEQDLIDTVDQIVEGDRLAGAFEIQKRQIDLDKNPTNYFLVSGLKANDQKHFVNGAMQLTE
jgi:hypothetical protein